MEGDAVSLETSSLSHDGTQTSPRSASVSFEEPSMLENINEVRKRQVRKDSFFQGFETEDDTQLTQEFQGWVDEFQDLAADWGGPSMQKSTSDDAKGRWVPPRRTTMRGSNVIGYRKTGVAAEPQYFGELSKKTQERERRITIVVDGYVGGVQGRVSKQCHPSMTVRDVVKLLIKRFPVVDDRFGLFLSASPKKLTRSNSATGTFGTVPDLDREKQKEEVRDKLRDDRVKGERDREKERERERERQKQREQEIKEFKEVNKQKEQEEHRRERQFSVYGLINKVKAQKGEWLEDHKRLMEYEAERGEEFFSNTFELKSKSGNTVIREQSYDAERAPPPHVFLIDPNSQVTVREISRARDASHKIVTDEKCWSITFEYSRPSRVPHKADMEGELMKQGSLLVKKNWKPQWFVLQDTKLFCFKTKPTESNTKCSFVINLKDGWVEVSDKSQKHYCFEVNQMDEVTGKQKRLYLGAKTWDSYQNWFEAFKKATSSTVEPKAVPIEYVKQEVTVTFRPQLGYTGLSPEWKQVFRGCGFTERQFYESPDEVIEALKRHRNSTSKPLVVHPVPKENPEIEDLINKDVSPHEIYSNFQLIGSGTFGEVYSAVNIASQQRVAIKKMLLTPKRQPLFISEINVQKSIEHPNVVKLFDAYRVGDHIWVALEYMDHGNLYEILCALDAAGELLTEPQIAYLITESLKAISYIHGMHRIHRDIKSDNILIGRSAEIKLADFGYAVQLGAEDEKRNTICGSPYWMAPEVIQGEEYGKGVDIWSLGIMLMECCDLQPPYISETPNKALLLIATQDPPPLRQPEKWSSLLKDFLGLCLQREPNLRPQAIELLQLVLAPPKNLRIK